MDLEKLTFYSLERRSIICPVYFQIVSRSNFSRYIVATKKELAQSLRIIEPGEINISPAAIILLGVNA